MILYAAPDVATHPFVFVDRTDAEAAVALIVDLGDAAGIEAARRAARSRDVGNVIHFCRWRQIGRLVELLSGEEAGAMRH
ncbi:MAG: hypothetical protein LC634_03625 [Sphingomonadales bacterium]|nr:hypothetical protein [Sphingomonadales bacterium]